MTPAMFIRSLVATALACVSCSFTQQPKSTESKPSSFTIRILNGKTGRPVTDELPNIWFGDAKDAFGIPTSAEGEIKVPIGNPEPQNIRFLPNHYVDCRYAKDRVGGLRLKIPLAEIISKGVVGDNVCGTQHAEPTPGVLVMYVRKRTLMEGMRL
jgi:hypothetical protein